MAFLFKAFEFWQDWRDRRPRLKREQTADGNQSEPEGQLLDSRAVMPAMLHPVFEEPPRDTMIWRYMDLGKFVSLLDHKALHFARVGVLHANDPYEGRFGDEQVTAFSKPWPKEAIEDLVAEIGKAATNPAVVEAFTSEKNAQLARTLGRAMLYSGEQYAEQCTFVNCWHMNPHESDAMWRLYSLQGQGIAIQSTFDRLERSLHMCPRLLYVGKVRYGQDMIDMGNGFNVVMNKRASFTHEAELRVATLESQFWQKPNPPTGVYATTDLEILIESIVVSPAAPQWLVDVTKSLVGRYGMSPSLVRQSPLYSRPPLPPLNG